MAPKVVVITGCSSGMGLSTAVHLASDKDQRYKVFATMRNLAKSAQLEVAAAGKSLNKTLFIRKLDVTNEASMDEFMEKMNKEEGGVDILINNAGIGQGGVVEKVSMQQIRTVYETNVFGLIRITQAVIPGMKAKRSGHIINVSSVGGLFGTPFADVYSSSKFAVNGFSESIAPLLRQFNVSVSVIEPGPVQTSFIANLSANKTGDITAELGPDVDELTKKCYKATMTGLGKRAASMMQTGDDIAQVIKEAIESPKPHLHYPTTDVLKKLTGLKFVDPTGDSVIQAIASRNEWE